jgi:hypothetical protein
MVTSGIHWIQTPIQPGGYERDIFRRVTPFVLDILESGILESNL